MGKSTSDPFDLKRFVEAQIQSYDQAREELLRGRKESHWMWFIFPQLQGLGMSPMARRYAISSLAEARAYLAHPVLGPRLAEITGLMLRLRGRTLSEILGSPDDMKFCSSMTLFAEAAGSPSIYTEALDAHCNGRADARTLTLLTQSDRAG